MKIFTTIIFLLTPNYLFANTNTFNCVFSFSEYINKQQPLGKDLLKLMQFDEIKIFTDFSSISKNKWVINKIYLENDLKQTLESVFDSSFDNLANSFRKILYDEKLSSADKELRKYLLKEAGISLSELQQGLKALSKKEKEQVLREYKIEFKKELNLFYKEFGKALDDITINQEEHFKNYINTFEKYGDIKVMGNKIEVINVTDAGMLIENIIDYKQLLKNESKDSVSLKMTFVDGNFALFTSKCFNTTYVNANNSDIIKSLIGNYEGELIYPNGDKLPITTEVYLNDSGNLEGKYTFADFGGEEIKGNLYNFEIKSANKILIKWRDVYGIGWLEVNYSNDNFLGTWGVINNDVFEKAGDWNGIKIINTDSIESRLKKLKSLFEDELITQDEYDAKRKEILDEM